MEQKKLLASLLLNRELIHHLKKATRTPELCLAAVKQDGWIIQELTHAERTPEVCKEAVEQVTCAITYLTKIRTDARFVFVDGQGARMVN